MRFKRMPEYDVICELIKLGRPSHSIEIAARLNKPVCKVKQCFPSLEKSHLVKWVGMIMSPNSKNRGGHDKVKVWAPLVDEEFLKLPIKDVRYL